MRLDDIKKLIHPFIAMVAILLAANIAVQYPLNLFGLQAWATWGTLIYPITFLVNDLTNRFHGKSLTTKLVMASFPASLLITALFVDFRIALASGMAFLISQQSDNIIFDYLRRRVWWQTVLVSSAASSVLDTWIFYAAAFAGRTGDAVYFGMEAPLWAGWAAGDLAFKLCAALILLAPYRMFLRAWPNPQSAAAP